MNTINCMIVDDEPLAREIIRTYIEKMPRLTITKSCMNAVEAFEGLQQYNIDVLFLDIRMPVVSGVDFLRSLKHIPLIVFTTAYAEYAVEGFELNAVDYLMKPITFDRFQQAVDKILKRLSTENIKKEAPAVKPANYFFIKQDTRLVKINCMEILYMEAQRDFSLIYLKNKKLLASLHLKALEEMMLPEYLLRVHRSYIVNLNAIVSLQGNTIEIEGREIPIGANYKDALFRKLGL